VECPFDEAVEGRDDVDTHVTCTALVLFLETINCNVFYLIYSVREC
jgi:hypothetical protein